MPKTVLDRGQPSASRRAMTAAPAGARGTILIAANSCCILANFRAPIIRGLPEAGYRVVASAPLDDTAPTLRAPGVEVDHPKAVARKSVEEAAASKTVELLGRTDDVRPFIADADCVVLPSYREGLPRVRLEASAMATPVIATDVPGCRHPVGHGITGLPCEVRSASSRLTSKRSKRSTAE